MALPHFHTMPKNIEPIFKSLYEALFITSDGNRFIANMERFEIVDNIIFCKIQDYPETSISNINKSKTLIIEYFNKPGSIIKIDILRIEIKNYRSEFDWNQQEKLSYIDVSFTILDSKSLCGDDLTITNREAIVKSMVRDEKLSQLLK